MAVIFFGTINYYCELLYTALWKYKLIGMSVMVDTHVDDAVYNLTCIIYNIELYDHISWKKNLFCLSIPTTSLIT